MNINLEDWPLKNEIVCATRPPPRPKRALRIGGLENWRFVCPSRGVGNGGVPWFRMSWACNG